MLHNGQVEEVDGAMVSLPGQLAGDQVGVLRPGAEVGDQSGHGQLYGFVLVKGRNDGAALEDVGVVAHFAQLHQHVHHAHVVAGCTAQTRTRAGVRTTRELQTHGQRTKQ